MKKKIAVIFGGRSVEHDVSIVTGLQAIENTDKRVFEPIPVYIARDGRWYSGESLLDVGIYKDFDPDSCKAKQVRLSTTPGKGFVYQGDKSGMFSGPKREVLKVDAALLCMHGMHGEDGSLQGLLELCDMPYTSAGVGGSAAGMDKAIMKKLFAGCGFPQVDYVDYTRTIWEQDEKRLIASTEDKIGYPAYVKPASLGSSIGITVAHDRAQLRDAIELAFMYDRKIVIEKAVQQPMEINCSVLGADGVAKASVCERPVGWEEFLTFEDKYMKDGKGQKQEGREIPAKIDDELTERIRALAVEVFNALDCKGVVRIDFLVDKNDGALYVNEINTIPGSLAFYLWEPTGLKYESLIEELVAIAENALVEKMKNNYAFDSNLLEKVKKSGSAGAKGNKNGLRRSK